MIKSWLVVPLLFGLAWLGYNWYKMPKFSNGTIAPDFETKKMDGSPLKLSDYKGKIVLLDFWGSWCRPCREANPSLRRLYDKYSKASFEKASGFEIISIGIETNEARWKQAIAKDGMIWEAHASTLQNFDDPVAVLYSVREIPTTYLLDEAGQIIGVNYSEIKISEILDRKLKK
jgi:thiol-disulfide isomerase/thioredoxin